MDVSRAITESVARRVVEGEGPAREDFDKLLSEVRSSDDADEYMRGHNPAFVAVAVGPLQSVMPWFVDNGYSLLPGKPVLVNAHRGVIVTIRPAFGNVATFGFANVSDMGGGRTPTLVMSGGRVH